MAGVIESCRNTSIDNAVNYVLNRKDIAETYLEDGRYSFTNNFTVRMPSARMRLDPRNWLFSDYVNDADASMVVYAMVEMALAHDLNVYRYLKFLLEYLPSE